MARPVILSVALTVALLLSDCTNRRATDFTEEPKVSIDLDQIRERGFLQAIVDNNSISYFIYRGRPMGYEYELLQSLTKYLKIELKIKVISGIEQSIDLLNKGEGDLIAFPLTITQDRTKYLLQKHSSIPVRYWCRKNQPIGGGCHRPVWKGD